MKRAQNNAEEDQQKTNPMNQDQRGRKKEKEMEDWLIFVLTGRFC